jgi:hypothetical protein
VHCSSEICGEGRFAEGVEKSGILLVNTQKPEENHVGEDANMGRKPEENHVGEDANMGRCTTLTVHH